MSLKFSLDDRSKMINHWMLQDRASVELIAETPEWKENQTLEAKVTVNGVELNFDAVENYFIEIYKGLEQDAKEQYSDVEQEVQRRVEQRLQSEAAPVIDKLNDIIEVLNSAGDIIKPYWEK